MRLLPWTVFHLAGGALISGVFTAVDLGGMGLVRKTGEQGCRALCAIQRRVRQQAAPLDVAIVGASPAGASAGLSAMHLELRPAIFEQASRSVLDCTSDAFLRVKKKNSVESSEWQRSGVLPTPLLQSIGIRFETQRGQA